MSPSHLRVVVSSIAAAVVLTACGGGAAQVGPTGAAPSPTPTPTPAPLPVVPTAQALSAYAQSVQSNTLSARDASGNTFVVVQTSIPDAGTTTFEGRTCNSSTSTFTLSENGVVRSTRTTTSYYTTNPYLDLGSTSAGLGQYEVVTDPGSSPTTSTVGDTFSGGSTTTYRDSSKSVVDEVDRTTVRVLADSASSVLMCGDDTATVTATGIADGLSAGSGTTCYRVDTNGGVTLVSVSLNVGATTLTFR